MLVPVSCVLPQRRLVLRKGRVWIRPHERDGHQVAGHFRDLAHDGAPFETGHGTMKLYPREENDPEDHVRVAEADRPGSSVAMPRASVEHFANDSLHRIDAQPNSGDPDVDAVIRDEGQFVARGNDGMVWRSPQGSAVKASTTTPYQPFNAGHRTPEGAIAHTRRELEAHEALRGLPMVPQIRGVEHGGRMFLVKPWLNVEERPKYTSEELERVAETMHGMHARGWTLNDTWQLGRNAAGELVLMDLGQATQGATTQRMRADGERLDSLFREQGLQRLTMNREELTRKVAVEGNLLAMGAGVFDAEGTPRLQGQKERARLARWLQLAERLDHHYSDDWFKAIKAGDDDELARVEAVQAKLQKQREQLQALDGDLHGGAGDP